MATPPPSRTPSKHPHQPAGVPVSSQRYLDVAQIRDGVVVLRDGSLRAIVLVNAVNFALKSEEEQNALIYAYQGFLNSFSFPIQIVMQSRQLDLAHYLKKLADQLAESTNELVQLQISDYIQFIERLIQIANIMDKKFYVTIPFSPPAIRQRGLFDKLFNPGNRLEVRMSPAEFKSYRQELLERARIIMSGLGGMGLRSALLGTQETIELLYATYNPEEATKERLSDVTGITGAYVHPASQTQDGNSKSQIPNPNEAPISNGQTAPTQAGVAEPAPVTANPLAAVVPESSEQTANSQQPTATPIPLAGEPGSANQEPVPTSQLPADAASNSSPITHHPSPGEVVLPEPLPPTSNAPAESPDAGQAVADKNPNAQVQMPNNIPMTNDQTPADSGQ